MLLSRICILKYYTIVVFRGGISGQKDLDKISANQKRQPEDCKMYFVLNILLMKTLIKFLCLMNGLIR